ncbi:MAG: SusD/RagB family nutrient-binding outer membrane lipoprotein, partial [Ferruginibacter sp.]
MIKKIKQVILIGSLLFFAACDKDFQKINTNPYAINAVDPALLFAGAQRTHLGTWNAEHIIVQQFVVPYNTGANAGFSFYVDIDGNSNPKWDQSYATGSGAPVNNAAPVKNFIQALKLLGDTTSRVNLRSMVRIWKAQVFMGLVDDYGDVPYSEAGRAVSDSNAIFYPKYDDDAVIYNDLYKEIKESIAALNPAGDYVSADLFYGANAQASTTTATATAQVAKWKKLGNSLLLRLGMRYSRLDAAKAQAIVAEAFAGGVMTSNADNAFVKNDGTLYAQNDNLVLQNFSQYNYAAEPFVNQLKATNDPRGKFMIAQFADPGKVNADPNPDVTLANQFGVPIGKTDGDLAMAPYRG